MSFANSTLSNDVVHALLVSDMSQTTRTTRIAVRLTPDEGAMLAAIADHDERTPSDAIRRLIRREAQALGFTAKETKPAGKRGTTSRR